MAGTREAIDRCRTHPLARALRIDKLSLGALEAVLRLHRDGGRDAARSIPVLAMLTAPPRSSAPGPTGCGRGSGRRRG